RALRHEMDAYRRLISRRAGDDSDMIDLASVREVQQRVNSPRVHLVVEVDDLRFAVVEHDLRETEPRRSLFDFEQETIAAPVDIHREISPAVLAIDRLGRGPDTRTSQRERRDDNSAEYDRREIRALRTA